MYRLSLATLPPTPLQYFPSLSSLLGIELWVKRDDLLPFTGGGNKVRKMLAIAEHVEATGADVVITNGGVQSNHCRVTAMLAAERGWGAVLVLHGEPDEASGNYLIAKLCGAVMRFVPASRIGETIEHAVAELKASGRNPYVIPGGGHCRAGANAYYQAAFELGAQWDAEVGAGLDRIVLASGTGATQGGLAAGLDGLGWNTALTGVSIARDAGRGRAAVTEVYDDLCRHFGGTMQRKIEFRDEWTEGGYDACSERVLATISTAAVTEGLILDATYTGKAFSALMDMRKRGEIRQGERVVFWHTGGLLNLASRTSVWNFNEHPQP